MERTIYMLVAYDGTDFHGFQTQDGVRTVQETLEKAVRRVVRHPMFLTGCGRTDAGVHAVGHVSSFVTNCVLDVDKMRYAIGSRLDDDLSVVELKEVHPEFNARRSATSKLYRYRIFNSQNRPVEQLVQRYTYHVWRKLDLHAMQGGAEHFVGHKSFAAMAGSKCSRLSKVRTILRCDVERHGDEVRIEVEGTGFLYKQVRNMVGTLISVGRGRWDPDHVATILESGDRTQAGSTAPAHGLCMQWVKYPSHLLEPLAESDDLAEGAAIVQSSDGASG